MAHNLKNSLKQSGHKSVLLVSKKYSDDADVKLIRPESNLRRRILKKATYYLANDLDFFPSRHILKMPEFINADVIHCHNLHTNYFNLKTLIEMSKLKPVVWTFHDMWPITAHCAHSFDGKIKENGFFTCPSLDIYPPIAWHNEKYLEKKKTAVYSDSNFHIVTPSKWLAEKVSQSVLRNKPISVIYNGIDTSIFKPYDRLKSRQELGLPQDRPIILTVAKGGASNPWKGRTYAQEAIKAFIGHHRAYFVDLGGDIGQPPSPDLKSAGYISDQTILAKYYSSADILLYPSVADNCPLVVLEAMACGLPIVSFNTGGIPELVEHKINGYIAEYKNTDDLKTGIEYLLNSSVPEIEQMRRYSVNKIKSGFTLEKMTEQYIELYKNALPLWKRV